MSATEPPPHTPAARSQYTPAPEPQTWTHLGSSLQPCKASGTRLQHTLSTPKRHRGWTHVTWIRASAFSPTWLVFSPFLLLHFTLDFRPTSHLSPAALSWLGHGHLTPVPPDQSSHPQQECPTTTFHLSFWLPPAHHTHHKHPSARPSLWTVAPGWAPTHLATSHTLQVLEHLPHHTRTPQQSPRQPGRRGNV